MTNWSNRSFSLWPWVAAAVLAVPLAMGGVSYRKEAEYGPANTDPGSINVQNREISQWGSGDYVGWSHYGPPFDVYIRAEAPKGFEGDTMHLDSVVISDGTAELRRVRDVEAPLEAWETVVGVGGTVMAATYVMQDALPVTPPRITIRVAGRMGSGTGSVPIDIAQTFELAEREQLHVGARTFPLK